MKSNDLTKEISTGIKRYARPSLKLISKWRQEWILKGLDFTTSFESYKKRKTNLWYQDRRKK